jgi:hypothetical protein
MLCRSLKNVEVNTSFLHTGLDITN